MNTNEFRIYVVGDVIEWQTLLSGMQIATLDGGSPDGAWTISGSCSWNPRSGMEAKEGDLALTRDDGAEIFATLADGSVVEQPTDHDDYRLSLRFTIDGGAGDFASAAGTLETVGRLGRHTFSLDVRVAVDAS